MKDSRSVSGHENPRMCDESARIAKYYANIGLILSKYVEDDPRNTNTESDMHFGWMDSQLDDYLGGRSSLTKKQIDRLLLQISLQKGGPEGIEGETGSRISGVSAGAYYRVLSQARSNIDQSLYTVLLCSRIGVLQMDDLRRLLDLISKAPSEVAEGDAEQLKSLVDALVNRIVML